MREKLSTKVINSIPTPSVGFPEIETLRRTRGGAGDLSSNPQEA